jgi:hypothetical protein
MNEQSLSSRYVKFVPAFMMQGLTTKVLFSLRFFEPRRFSDLSTPTRPYPEPVEHHFNFTLRTNLIKIHPIS